jgi:hypothetical protein
MKRLSKDLIRDVGALGFDHVWTNAQGFQCFVHPDDPEQTELSIRPSIGEEQIAKTLLRRAQKIAGAMPRIEKRNGSRVKERADAERHRAQERLRLVRDKQARLHTQQAASAEVERIRLLVERRERELAEIEHLMLQPPGGSSVHRGTAQARHCAGGRR